MEEGNPTVDEVVLLSSSGDPRFPGLPPGDDDIDIKLMEQERHGGPPLPRPTQYDLLLQQLNNAVNQREAEVGGRPQGQTQTHLPMTPSLTNLRLSTSSQTRIK